jgi:hypothetical protein
MEQIKNISKITMSLGKKLIENESNAKKTFHMKAHLKETS